MQSLTLNPDWKGETVFVVAGGTSVAALDLEPLRGRKVIAVNSSYERVPFAQYIFFADDRWWQEHQSRAALKQAVANGAKLVTCSRAAVDRPGGLQLYKMKRVCPVMRPIRNRPLGPGYAASPDSVVAQRTSLQGAMNMAGHLGAAVIVLLGADAGRGPDGKSHHHTPHKWDNKPGNKTWDIQMGQLQFIVAPLQERGIRVINCSMASRIPWWPKASLEDVLAGKEIPNEVVMPTPPKEVAVPNPIAPTNKKKTGYSGGIMFDDAAALTKLAHEFNIKKILEFGPGASTRIWLDAGIEQIVSCEHDPAWLGKARALYAHESRVRIVPYANKQPAAIIQADLKDGIQFDAVLVDSPQAYKPHHLTDGMARINTLRLAFSYAPVVFLHDAKRPGEQASLKHLEAQGHKVRLIDTRKGIAVITRIQSNESH